MIPCFLAALSPHCLLLLKSTCPGTCVTPLGTVRAQPGSVLRPPPSLPILSPDILFQALPTSHVLQPQFPEQGLPELPALTSTRLLSSSGTHESNTRRSISTPSSPPPPAFPQYIKQGYPAPRCSGWTSRSFSIDSSSSPYTSNQSPSPIRVLSKLLHW